MGLTKDDVQNLKDLAGAIQAFKTLFGAGAPAGAPAAAPGAAAPAVVAAPPKKKEIGPADWTEYAIDLPTIEGLKIADREGYSTAFHRARTMTACPIGKGGTCCKICNMGPCRVLPPREKPRHRKKERREQVSVALLPRPSPPVTLREWFAAGAAATATTAAMWLTPSCTQRRANFLTTKSKTSQTDGRCHGLRHRNRRP